MWDLFESLAYYHWQYVCATESFVYPSHLPMISTINLNMLINLRTFMITILLTHMMYVPIANLFDHDVNSYPCYSIPDESYARLNVMIEIMNERHEYFVSEMKEFGLSY